MNTITWTVAAEDTYLAILEDLRANWNDDVAYKFYISVEKFIDGLRNFKHLCPLSFKMEHFRRCVISKHLSFTYRTSGNQVEIIAFYFNRSLS